MSWVKWVGVVVFAVALLGPLVYLMYESWFKSGKK